MIDRNPWPFDEPRDAMLLVAKQLLVGERPVLSVVHESGPFPWRIGGGGAPLMGKNWQENSVVIGLEEVLEFFPWLAELADLPPGTRVTRAAEGEPWIVEGKR